MFWGQYSSVSVLGLSEGGNADVHCLGAKPCAFGLLGVTLETGKRYSQTVEESYHLTMAALEPPQDNKKSSKYVSVVVENDDSEYTLCTLEPNRNLQVQLDLMFGEGEQVTYYLKGEGTVHLTGYLVSDLYDDYMNDEEEDEESSEEEVEESPDVKGGKRKNEALESSPESGGKKAKVEAKTEKVNDKVAINDKNVKEEKVDIKKIKKENNISNLNSINKESGDSDDSEDDDESEDEANDSLGLIDSEAIEVDSDEEDDEEEDEESDLSGIKSYTPTCFEFKIFVDQQMKWKNKRVRLRTNHSNRSSKISQIRSKSQIRINRISKKIRTNSSRLRTSRTNRNRTLAKREVSVDSRRVSSNRRVSGISRETRIRISGRTIRINRIGALSEDSKTIAPTSAEEAANRRPTSRDRTGRTNRPIRVKRQAIRNHSTKRTGILTKNRSLMGSIT